jgi:hypothetical protein
MMETNTSGPASSFFSALPDAPGQLRGRAGAIVPVFIMEGRSPLQKMIPELGNPSQTRAGRPPQGFHPRPYQEKISVEVLIKESEPLTQGSHIYHMRGASLTDQALTPVLSVARLLPGRRLSCGRRARQNYIPPNPHCGGPAQNPSGANRAISTSSKKELSGLQVKGADICELSNPIQ